MQTTTYGLIQLFADGGFMMYPLILASLLGLGVIIAKAYILWAAKREAGRVLRETEALARDGKIDEAIALAESTPGPVPAILLSGLRRVKDQRPGRDVEKAMTSTGTIELGFLERGLVVLATIASVAPLMGFLGTVWGMINAFGAIEAAGQVEATLVAAGIKIALLTTAAGLIIAIPVNIAYNYFVTRIDQMIVSMEEGSTAVLALFWDVYGGRDEVSLHGSQPPRAGQKQTLDSASGTRERPIGFDTQSTIVPDKDTMVRPEHRKLT
ncbi:MAG: MotA/TolQ/ExbB proton channel family protein [Gemmatimonadetes bacterium]|nr:MotA/TolQ/ExbB proton channel family protein [Gemmatimonadota bacterium]